MPTHLIIGAGAGLVSAALFASAAVSPSLAVILFYLAPLPLCLAGLGWGRSAALVAAASSTLIVALGLGPAAAMIFAVVFATPIAFLVHLLLLSRQPTTPPGAPAANVEWYPPGRLVGWAAVIAGVLAGVFVLLVGYDQEAYRQSIADVLSSPAVQELDPEGKVFTPDTIENLTALIAKALPGMLSVTWLTIVLFNLWLAGFIVKASGRALRPWPSLQDLELPGGFVAVFAVAILMSFIPGLIGLLATGLAAAMLIAYVLQGLVVIHVYSRAVPFRGLLLTAVYLGILLLGWVAILVAILGLGEPLFGLRARSARSGQPPHDNKSN
jgi:hypothetical protein